MNTVDANRILNQLQFSEFREDWEDYELASERTREAIDREVDRRLAERDRRTPDLVTRISPRNSWSLAPVASKRGPE